jgi:hypothetical protein
MSGKYDPLVFSKAMGTFKEHLSRTSPEAWHMLKTPSVGFNYTPEAFVHYFWIRTVIALNVFPSPRLLIFWPEATGAIEFDLKLKLKDFGTRLEHETLFEHARSGVQVRHLIRDDSGNEQNIDRN